MDIYLKSLIVNSKGDDLDEITKPFAKVFKWLSEQIAYADEYNFKYIETLIKSVVFLHENYTAHGHEILKNLSNDESFHKTFFETHIQQFSDLNHISLLSQAILNSSNSMGNAILLDNIFKHLKALYPTLEVIYTGNSKGISNITGVKRKKLFMIINRLFRVPSSQFDNALERICHSVSFDIIGLIFTEDCRSIVFDKCALLINILCDGIMEPSKAQQVSSNFMRSIIACVISSNEGKTFYKKCLSNERFSTSICQYFRNFINTVYNVNCTLTTYHGLPIMELFYLFYVSLEIMANKLIEACSGIGLSNFITKLCILFQ